MIIVNTTTSFFIKLHRQYVLISTVLLVVGVIEQRGQCSLKGEGSVTTLVKTHVKIYKTTVMGYVIQAEWWEKHPSGYLFRLLWLK